ncbi:MAG TPA: type III secretion system effector BopA family protein [Arsenophonus nasoniae]|uniref:type III secretion system effector BopA family protein n=1 Tax=Arsenophonus nasoniae TaxID=638 RepID=UPI00387A2A0E
MTIELDRFSKNLWANPCLISGQQDQASSSLVHAQMSFNDHVLSTLAKLPFLKNENAIRTYVARLNITVQQKLTVFLRSLAERYGLATTEQTLPKLDLSPKTPLAAHKIEFIPQSMLLAMSQAHSASSHQAENINNKIFSLIQFSNAIKELVNQGGPAQLPIPTSIPRFGNWFYWEDKNIQKVQQAIADYHKLVEKNEYQSASARLLALTDLRYQGDEFSDLYSQLKSYLDFYQQALDDIEQCCLTVPSSQQVHLTSLLEQVLVQKEHIAAVAGQLAMLPEFWQQTVIERQIINARFVSLPEELRNVASESVLLLSHQLIEMFDQVSSINDWQAQLTEFWANAELPLPSPSELTTLVAILASERPALAGEVAIPFKEEKDKIHSGIYQQLIQILTRSLTQVKENKSVLKERLGFEDKQSKVRSQAALLSNWLNRAGEESYLHEQYVAAMLIAISGERCSMQDRTVIADGAVNIDNLELEPGCEADIQQLATEEKWVVLARKVLTAQDKVYRFEELYDRQSSHSAINFHYDVEQRVLTSRLMASPERYLPFLTKKISALTAYHNELQSLTDSLNIGKVRSRFAEELKQISEQKQHLSLLQDAVRFWQSVKQQYEQHDQYVDQLQKLQDITLQQVRELNKQGYLAFLPLLQQLNLAMYDLSKKKECRTAELSAQGSSLNDSQLQKIEQDMVQLDDEYQAALLLLVRFDRQANKMEGYPEQGDYYNVQAWQHWVLQNITGEWGGWLGEFRPDLKTLILQHQLAKNGMQTLREAYQALYQIISPSLFIKSLDTDKKQEILAAFRDLHHWVMAHPMESQALAKNITHAYQIITGNSGWFGAELATAVSSIWQTATVENQVKDILLGTRELLPLQPSYSMSPEMIALLHFTHLLPYLAAGIKGGVHSGLISSVAALLGAGWSTGMICGFVQTWLEQKIASTVSDHRNTEVMVNALMLGIREQGSFQQRAASVVGYVIKCQLLQDIGTLGRYCFETNKVGTLRRWWQDTTNVWQKMDVKAKLFSVAAIAGTAAISATVAAAALIFTVGTGGVGLAVLGIGALLAATVGGYFGYSGLSLLKNSDFLGFRQAYEYAQDKMTEQRIQDALQQFINKQYEGKTVAEHLDIQVADIKKHISLKQVAKQDQTQSFMQQLENWGRTEQQKIDIKQQKERAELVNKVAQQLNDWRENDGQELTACLGDIDKALVQTEHAVA